MVRKYSDLIILSFLWIISLYSVIIIVSGKSVFSPYNYIGYGLLLVLSILRYRNVGKFKTILGIFLFIGAFNLIRLTSATFIFKFTVKLAGFPISIQFEPICFLLLVFLVIANLSYLLDKISDFFSADPRTAIANQNAIDDHYYKELSTYSDTELQEIIENKKHYPYEHYKAARRLLFERKTDNN